MAAGDIVHVEFPSADADRAQRFWGELFGWSFEDSGMAEMDYRIARTGEQMAVAIFPSEKRSATLVRIGLRSMRVNSLQ